MLHNTKNKDLRFILVQLRRFGMHSTEAALDRAINEEAEALLAIPPVTRITMRRRLIAREDAEGTYAELIKGFIDDPGYRIKPDDILSYRCKATAWAIAQKILVEEAAAAIPFG